MSYTIRLRAVEHVEACSKCGNIPADSSPDLPNPTYNLTPIFDFALTGEPLPNPEVSQAAEVLMGVHTDRPRGLRLLDGRKAGETQIIISDALRRLRASALRNSFEALQPKNGWGTLNDAVWVLEQLLLAATAYPSSVWYIQ